MFFLKLKKFLFILNAILIDINNPNGWFQLKISSDLILWCMQEEKTINQV